jgi:hypothetical protein
MAPGTDRLKLNDDNLLSIVGFNFNLRLYSMGADEVWGAMQQMAYGGPAGAAR